MVATASTISKAENKLGKRANQVDTNGWLTQSQAADLLGVSRVTLARWAREGSLNVQYAQRGDSIRMLTLYDPAELARMPRRYRATPDMAAGELAARVFECLNQGMTMRDIVVETREMPSKIETLTEIWMDSGGASMTINPAAKAELERFCGPFGNVTELVQRIATICGERIEATVCEDASDAQIEHAIVCVLDQAEAANPAPAP